MSYSPDSSHATEQCKRKVAFSICNFLLVTIASVFFSSTWAQSSEHPIQISADNAERSERLGHTIYRGNVIIEQGLLLLKGNTVMINTPYKNNHLSVESAQDQQSVIEATGAPAFFHQRDNQGVIVIAEANTIEYFPETGIIMLTGNAAIDQAGYIVTGDKIEYSTQLQSIKANADPKNNKTRVRTVIKPKSSIKDKDKDKESL